jgi:hypothetical protein
LERLGIWLTSGRFCTSVATQLILVNADDGVAVSLLELINLYLGQFVVLFAAALNGISASLLWTAQGQLCMAYPTEVNKYCAYVLF